MIMPGGAPHLPEFGMEVLLGLGVAQLFATLSDAVAYDAEVLARSPEQLALAHVFPNALQQPQLPHV